MKQLEETNDSVPIERSDRDTPSKASVWLRFASSSTMPANKQTVVIEKYGLESTWYASSSFQIKKWKYTLFCDRPIGIV